MEPEAVVKPDPGIAPDIAKVQPGFEVYTYDGRFGKVREVLLGTEEEGGSYLGIKRGWFSKECYLSAKLVKDVDPPTVTLQGHEDEIKSHMTEARPAAFRTSA